MKANIYIHIGLHKTGTSSIQSAFFHNRKTLLAHGINYPPLSENHSVTLFPLFARTPHKYRFNQLAGIDTEEKAAKKNAATLAALRRELEANRSGSIVISGEGLSGLRAWRLERLRSELAPYAARFRIIVYVRDPYSTVNSIFQHRIREGDTNEQIIAAQPRPLYSRIGPSVRVFGRENVDIRMFDAAHFVNGDLIADFLAAIDAPPGLAEKLGDVRANVALSHEAAYLMHEINKYYREGSHGSLDPGRRAELLGWLAEIPGQPYRCPPEVFVAVQPLIAKQVRWLNNLLGKKAFPERPIQPETAPYWSEKTLTALALLLNDLPERVSLKSRVKRGFLQLVDAVRRLTRATR